MKRIKKIKNIKNNFFKKDRYIPTSEVSNQNYYIQPTKSDPVRHVKIQSVKVKLKSDKYKKARGGASKLLDIICTKCNLILFQYQKDGSGSLKRLYLDRIISRENSSQENLVCPNCKELLATYFIYPKETRAAYRIIPGKIAKKISK